MSIYAAYLAGRAFLHRHGKLVALVAVAVLILAVSSCAVRKWRDDMMKAHDQGVVAERAVQDARKADATRKVEAARVETTAVIADAAVKARAAAEPSRVVTRDREIRDAGAIAAAPTDPMVADGGPLDRMFGRNQ